MQRLQNQVTVKKVAAWASPCRWLAGKGSRRAGPVRGKSTCQVTGTHSWATCFGGDILFSKDGSATHDHYKLKNSYDLVSAGTGHRGRNDLSTHRPPQWLLTLCPEGDVLPPLCYGMQDQRPGQQFSPSLDLQKLRGGKKLRLTNRLLVAFD